MKFLRFVLILLMSCSNQTDSQNVDSDFNDFILEFGLNPDFQQSRVKFPIEFNNLGTKTTIEKRSWTNQALFHALEATTCISNGLKINKKTNERVFSWIITKKGISKNYYFHKENGKWILVKIDICKDSTYLNSEYFYSFLSKFCNDSIFQKQRIRFPIDMTYLTEDFTESINEKREQEKWKFTGFYYHCDSIATTYYDFQRTFKDSDERVLTILGIGNGINAIYTFKRIENKWVMIKYEDFST